LHIERQQLADPIPLLVTELSAMTGVLRLAEMTGNRRAAHNVMTQDLPDASNEADQDQASSEVCAWRRSGRAR
jgi:hypothetical protein